ALIAIGQYSSTIETVDAGWCKDITDQGATQIAQSSKSLRYLGLMRCDKVTRLNTEPANIHKIYQYKLKVSTKSEAAEHTLPVLQRGWMCDYVSSS
uniref:F-box and leucine rich repeat protein 17 n=1 Tax=Poecilia formosa TaxID=48698 RepID=A0A096MCU3_POEFO